MTEGFAGTRTMLLLALRRDRLTLPAWVLLFVVMAWFSADATVGLYPDTASRTQAAEAINGTPSLVALYGRIYDVTSLGAIAMIKMGGIGAALLAVLAYMLVIRHTRAEEEGGRLELLAGGVVGAYAPLTAALAAATGMAVAVGILTAGALSAAGLPATGSLAFGLAWAATGTVFAAVGAVAAQLTASARAARGLATAALGFAYLLRAVGDSSGDRNPTWLTWSSPIGWGQQVRPFAGDRWPVLLLLVASAAVAVAAAFALDRGRDLGAGLVADRAGRGSATRFLRSPLALAFRLQRGALLSWAAGLALVGFVLGNVAGNVSGFVESAQARDLFTKLGGVKGLTDAFVSTELGFIGIMATAFGISAVLRMRGEETELRLEAVLATGASRIRWAASQVAAAVLGTLTLMLVAGLSIGVARVAATGNLSDLGEVVAGALAYLPAIWLVLGLVVAAYGLAPRLAALGWAALVVFLLIGELGPLLDLPSWALDLSPYAHVPRLPGGELRVTPLLWLTGLAAVFVALGLAGFRRRDVGRA